MSGCRIARVRDKSSGRSLEIISRPRREGHAATLVEHAATIADGCPTELIGFMIIGVGRDGSYQAGWRLRDDAPFGPTLFGAFIGEIVRREMVTDSEIRSFMIRHGWLIDAQDET